jgi:prepilin-type N-terminal cleavage/methylation domain-containing protein
MQFTDSHAGNSRRGLRNPRSKGFTLIETIITLVVLSIAAVGVLSVFTIGIQASADPLALNRAVSLAQAKTEDVIALRKSGGFNAVVADPGGAFPAPFGAYAWARTVDCVTAADVNTPTGAPPCASGYARARVTVSWNAGADSVVLTTLVSSY